MNIHWRRKTDWRMEVAPVLMGFGAGVLIMVGEEFAGMLILATGMVLEFLEIDVKPKAKKVEEGADKK